MIEKVRAAVRAVAAIGEEFTSDEVWIALGGSIPYNPTIMGTAFNAERQAGTIIATGRHRPSNRPAARRRNIQVWEQRRR